MILLKRGTLEAIGWIRPESVGLDLEERNSRCVLTLGPEDAKVALGDWMTGEEAEHGKKIVWRVSSIEDQYDNGTRRVTLEHLIQELRDRIIFGELQLHGTAKNALKEILKKTSYWTLGGCDISETQPYEFDGETLFDAAESVTETLEDAYWDYDMTAMPFKLYIRKQDSAARCEMRPGRNLRTLQKTIDRTGMYTRFYPIGKDELHISGNYVSRNTDKYGIITQTETNQAIDDAGMLKSWAQARLRRHAMPTVTITAGGLDLADATGESLDFFAVNTVCRIPMPEIGETVEERITRISWSDRIRDPEGVTVTMSNKRDDPIDLASQIKRETAAARSGGRAGSKQAAEDHAWFTDTEEHVSMTAEAIVGKNADGTVDWGRVADITVNGNGIYSTVTKTEKGLVTAQSAITQLEDRINLMVRAVGADGTITAASIIMAINSGKSSIDISADRISLSGSVKLGDAMTASALGVNFKKSVNISGSNGIAIGAGGYISLGAYSIRLDTLQSMIKSASVNGNVLTLTPFYGEVINFSKATTLRGKWSGGDYTVTAKQNDVTVETNKTTIKQLQKIEDLTPIGNFVGANIAVYATENGGSNGVSTGFTQQIWLDAQDIYDKGKTDGAGGYRLYGYFGRYGTVTIEGVTYQTYVMSNSRQGYATTALYSKT